MRKATAIILILFGMLTMTAQQSEHFFPYPTVPDSKNLLSERCNYLVYKFWEQCPIKQSFSSMTRLNQAFGDWISFMPYATNDTINLAIDNYLASVAKQAPDQMLSVGKMAEGWLYSDTAQYTGDDIYLRFAKAMINGKKVPKAEKARFDAQVKMIESSSVGHQVPSLPLTTPHGETIMLGDVQGQTILLFINDPDCFDCKLAKTRLSADMNTNKAIEAGLLKIVSIYPGEPTDEWRAEAAKYPATWTVGANGDIDLYFNVSDLPKLYVLNDQHVVLAKNLELDNLLYLMQALASQTPN